MRSSQTVLAVVIFDKTRRNFVIVKPFYKKELLKILYITEGMNERCLRSSVDLDMAMKRVVIKIPLFLFLICLFFAGCKQTEPLPESYLLTGNQFASCIDVLKEALLEGEDVLSFEAARVLTQNGYGFEIVTPYLDWLENEENAVKRAQIATELLRAQIGDVIVDLHDILLQQDPVAIEFAVKGIYEASDRANSELLTLVRDSIGTPKAKFYAQATLDQFKGENTILKLARTAFAADSLLKLEAVTYIGMYGSAEDIPGLLAFRDQIENDADRLEVTGALAILGYANARQDILNLLKTRDAVRRARAAYFAGQAWMVDESARLYALLEDPDMEVRIRAAESLLVLGDTQSIARLRRADLGIR